MGKMQETISVALCTYNGQRFLPQQLASIANQTRLPDEVIACDDRSTDGTIEVLREFAASVSFPVRIVENEHNLGSAKNFERAIRLCSGTLIALCDQDDQWYPQRLECSEKELLAHPEAGLVFSDGDIVDEQDHPTGQRLWQSFIFTEDRRRELLAGKYELLLSHRFVTGATVTFRSILRDRCFPVAAPFIHDEWMAAMLVVFCELRAIEQPLIRYRRHTSQQVGSPAIELPRWKIQNHWNTLARGEKTDSYWRQLARNVSFAEQICIALSGRLLDERGCSVLQSYQDWLSFASFRFQLPEPRYRRLAPIVKNYAGYATHALGFTSAAKDLLRSRPNPSFTKSN